MSKKKFNPKNWNTIGTDFSPSTTINTGTNQTDGRPSTTTGANTTTRPSGQPSPTSDIDTITARIESTGADIAPNYPDWCDLGFTLADALGESGRSYYHRLSRFYPKYDQKETDKQFTNCLKSKGHGVTIKTLYHLAKTAGVDVAIKTTTKKQTANKQPKSPNCQIAKMEIWQFDNLANPEEEAETLPTIPEEIFTLLPDYLRQITMNANSREDADLLLLGSLVVISACLPNVHGIYGGVTVFPNLFLFVSAQASAGKGRLSLCRRLVEPVHRQLREQNKLEQNEYKRKLVEYAANKKDPDAEQPQEPPLRVLFIPANSSATAVFQILNDNDGVGLMFETEGDTLAQTFKSEHGNYSDGFRKAFHHEKISYLRRKDREYVTLENPKLSVLLSGTPRQVKTLIPDAENGLFSRFIFYCMNIRLQWIDVFAYNESESLDQRFNRLGDNFFDFYLILKKHDNIRFTLSRRQQTEFNHYFEQIQLQYWELLGSDYIGTIRRLGLITFRIAMILTVLRLMDTTPKNSQTPQLPNLPTPNSQTPNSQLSCSDTDFNIAMEILKILLQHASHVFRHLPKAAATPPTGNPKMLLFQSLPEQFDRAKYIEIAKLLQIPESTADKQIARFVNAGLLTKEGHGCYVKKDKM
ncbi:DUF3987 domain-containing protein [Bacteroidales bacterium OttesenSCG-928-B11]|nr:DUF3987 domain-containing protein [Bacteroidales bacterium OttesenSCG-928-B11]MDL2326807.1 DUF3987 domain-containing protein [Bacteroidales bacterium OttesenSCG-928-A14]